MQEGNFFQKKNINKIMKKFQSCILQELKKNHTNAKNAVRYFLAKGEDNESVVSVRRNQNKRNHINARIVQNCSSLKNIEEFSNLCSARRIYTEEKLCKCNKCSQAFSCKRRN